MNANSIFSRDPATYSEHPEQFKWMQADLTNPLTCIASIIKGDDKIVDIGCGAGLLGRYLSKIYPSVHISGIDPSIEAGHLGIAPYRHFFSGGLEDALDFDWVKDAGWYIFADVIEHLVYPDLMLKQLVEKYSPSECSIYIITSDNDYLQLIRENVHIYNLAFKNLKDSKIFTGNPEKDLKIKTIMGDTSDNIPSVFPKCGIKTAIKCVEDPDFFEKKMNNNAAYYEQYLLNDTLVSFDKIPEELVNEFINQQPTNHL